MGSVGNPNPWATYDNFKDCSQAICSTYCPQFCNLIFPPPPPLDADSGSSFSPLIIAVIGVLATGLLLVSYYIILSRYCKRSDDQNIVVGTDESSGEAGNDSGQMPSSGLDESLIKNITVFKYQKSDGSIEVSDYCAVCLSEFQENESLRLLPKCSHAFHLPCIDTWLKSHLNCPLCRAAVVVVVHPNTPPEAGTLASAAVNASPFEVHRPNDLTLVVDDQECHEQVVVSLQDDQETRDVNAGSDQEIEQFRRSISVGTFSCRQHLLISDVLKIEEDLEFGSGEHWKSIGSSNGFGFEGSESSPVDAKRSISAGTMYVHSS